MYKLDEVPKYRKKSIKHHAKSDHKHLYADKVIVRYGYHGWIGMSCSVCSKLQPENVLQMLHQLESGDHAFENLEDLIRDNPDLNVVDSERIAV